MSTLRGRSSPLSMAVVALSSPGFATIRSVRVRTPDSWAGPPIWACVRCPDKPFGCSSFVGGLDRDVVTGDPAGPAAARWRHRPRCPPRVGHDGRPGRSGGGGARGQLHELGGGLEGTGPASLVAAVPCMPAAGSSPTLPESRSQAGGHSGRVLPIARLQRGSVS